MVVFFQFWAQKNKLLQLLDLLSEWRNGSSTVIRMFDALGIPNIKQRELSNIVKSYTIFAAYKVWQEEQSAKLQEIEGQPIVIASDMRVDSPCHYWPIRIRKHIRHEKKYNIRHASN